MSAPTWQSEQACEEEGIVLNINNSNPQVTHGLVQPDEWNKFILGTMNQDNRDCWRLCVKYCPPAEYPFSIDLFLAETMKTLSHKINYFKEEQKENVKYDAITIYQGNKLGRNLWKRMLTRPNLSKEKEDKFQAAFGLKEMTGLPNFKIVQAYLKHKKKPSTQTTQRPWMRHKHRSKQKAWRNVNYVHFSNMYVQQHTRGEPITCIELGVVVLALSLESSKCGATPCVYDGSLGAEDNYKPDYLYDQKEFKDDNIDVNPIISQYCNGEVDTV